MKLNKCKLLGTTDRLGNVLLFNNYNYYVHINNGSFVSD